MLTVAVGTIVALALVVSLVFWRAADHQRARAEEAAGEARRAEEGQREARRLADARATESLRAQELERAARTEADAKALDLRRALDDYDLLANVVKLREAIAAEAQLYPAWPERAPAMRAWLEQQGRPLAQALPKLQATMAELRARAVAAGTAGGGNPAAVQFAGKSEQFLHDTLARLVDDLRAFCAPATGTLAAVERRLQWADQVYEETVVKYEREWSAAIADIAGAAVYHGLRLVPQLDLVPLRRDPGSGLWEFVHLRSGTPGKAIPQRNPDTRQLEITEDSGMVLVLLPGGTFVMGAQRDDPSAPNLDPGATPQERPCQPVELTAFFLGKHELTQAQWRRLSEGGEPSAYKPGKKPGGGPEVSGANPVENVSWQDCTDLLQRHGLQLPTEAQWEYACRAGTTTPWSTGAEAASLHAHANLADLAAQRAGSQWPIEPGFDDGFVVHAPVGSFGANAFGLFDMHGNVWEWCQDGSGPYGTERRTGDGLRLAANEERRVSRGGSFAFPASDARSAYRFFDMAGTRDANLGLRVMRRILSE
jgi:formylglycine-generating enzyme required for sulfatase activity